MVRFMDLAEVLGCPAAMHATLKVLRFDSAGPHMDDIGFWPRKLIADQG